MQFEQHGLVRAWVAERLQTLGDPIADHDCNLAARRCVVEQRVPSRKRAAAAAGEDGVVHRSLAILNKSVAVVRMAADQPPNIALPLYL